ncbi:hypothetical protein NN561_017919 [Cricetulus griseus]
MLRRTLIGCSSDPALPLLVLLAADQPVQRLAPLAAADWLRNSGLESDWPAGLLSLLIDRSGARRRGEPRGAPGPSTLPRAGRTALDEAHRRRAGRRGRGDGRDEYPKKSSTGKSLAQHPPRLPAARVCKAALWRLQARIRPSPRIAWCTGRGCVRHRVNL